MKNFDESIPLNANFQFETEWHKICYIKFVKGANTQTYNVNVVCEGVFTVGEKVV